MCRTDTGHGGQDEDDILVRTAFAAPAPVVEHIAPDPTVYVAPAPVVEYISPNLAEYAVAEYITPAPMEFAEAALHEIDEEICRDDFEELSYVARMSRKRLWRRVWHGCSSPSGASKSERSWRRLSKRLCYEEGGRRDEADVRLLWHV